MTDAHRFTYQVQPMRVVFGAGSLEQIPEEVAALGLRSVLVLSTPGRADTAQQVADMLGERVAAVHATAVMHVPAEVAQQARTRSRSLRADGCVVVGGGSSIGLGKALALDPGLPVIAVPTTYSGSEMTRVWGLTENGQKRTGADDRVLPRTVIYDPRLTVSLSVGASVSSGMNAIAHAAEALYAPDTSPIIALMAEEGIRKLPPPQNAANTPRRSRRTHSSHAWMRYNRSSTS